MTDFVFVHGGGQGGWVWDECIAAISTQSAARAKVNRSVEAGVVRCLALDAPGCGAKRGRDTAAMAYDDIVAELIADVAKSGLTDIVLVGHSQAGMVLPRMVEARPGLFRHLVYVTCSAPPSGITTTEWMGDGVHGQHADTIGWPVDPGTSSNEERFRIMFCNDMDEREADGFLAKLGKDGWPPVSYATRDWRYDHLAAVPATYVQCLRDMTLPPPWQANCAERLQAGAIVRIDAGHQVMNTRPQALAEVLLSLSCLRDGAGSPR